MAGQQLSKQQAAKRDTALAPIVKKAKDEDVQKNIGRFGDKWLRYKLGIRGTGPHSHGLAAETRTAIYEALKAAFPKQIKDTNGRKSAPAAAEAEAAPAASPSADES